LAPQMFWSSTSSRTKMDSRLLLINRFGQGFELLGLVFENSISFTKISDRIAARCMHIHVHILITHMQMYSSSSSIIHSIYNTLFRTHFFARFLKLVRTIFFFVPHRIPRPVHVHIYVFVTVYVFTYIKTSERVCIYAYIQYKF